MSKTFPIWILVCVLVSAPATAGPLTETLKWTAGQSAGQFAGDHFTSWYFDNHRMACFENNPLLMRDDQRYSVPKGWAFNAISVGSLSALLYVSKRTHHPRLERITKVAMTIGASNGAYFGLHNLIGCSGQPMKWASD